MHGAAVTLRRCTLANGFPAAVAHGAGTALHLHVCTLEACLTDVMAESGAIVTAAHCRSSGCIRSLIARDAGTAVSCHDCSLSGVPGGEGILADGSFVLLRGCSIQKFEYGVIVDGRGAAAELHGCSVTAGMHPVISREGALVLLRRTHVLVRMPLRAARPPPGSGAQAWLVCMEGCETGRSGGAAQLERCTLDAPEREQLGVAVRWSAAVTLLLCKVSCGGNGVSVCERGRAATVSHCTVQSKHSAACFVEQPVCTVRVIGGRVEGGQCAGVAAKGGRLVMRDACAGGLPGVGALCAVTARLGGTATLLRCALRNAQRGVLMMRAAVYATDVTVSGLTNAENYRGEEDLCSTGFRQYGGTLSVAGGSVTGCTIGVAVSTEPGDSTPGAADFEDVTFDGNGISVRVCDGANCAVSVVRCEFSTAAGRLISGVMPEQVAVLALRCQRAVSVQDSTFRGHQRDIISDGGITVSGCTFLGGHGEGPNLLVTGSGTVRNCSFEGAPGGIAQRGFSARGHRLDVHGCVFEGGVLEGISIEGSQASISACRFDGGNKAIIAMRDAKVAVRDSECTGADVGLQANGATSVRAQRLTFTGCKDAVTVDAGAAQRTVMTLLDCVATGSELSCVSTVSAGVEVLVTGCTLEDSPVGLSVNSGASVRVVNSRVTDCGIGALVGMPKESLRLACRACGQSGASGMARAWRALHAGGPGGVEGAACVHEGAVAIATLEDVVMSGCTAGLQASCAGRVTAQKLDVRGAQIAYALTRIGDPHSFEDCTASGGSRPAVRSDRMLGPEEGYRLEPEACAGIQIRGGPPAPPLPGSARIAG